MSKKLDDWSSFEGTKVSVMLKAMSMFPSAVFLDIGSNIGKYLVISYLSMGFKTTIMGLYDILTLSLAGEGGNLTRYF